MPKISVIIPTYNRARFITRAIDSVLKQSYQDYEILVIDDGSSDDTQAILAKYQDNIIYIKQTNQGVSSARNKGIQQAQGKYIAFLDSDDTWDEKKLEIQIAIFEKNSKVGLVHNKMIMLNEQSQKIGIKPKRESGANFEELLEIGGDLPTSSVMVRKECFEKVGLFDVNLAIMEDFEMWLRIAKNYDIYEIKDKFLAYYYRHDHQVTKNRINVFEGTVQLQRKILRIHQPKSRSLVRKKLYHNQYLLARAYYDEKKYVEALTYLSRTIVAYPLVGITFYHLTDTWIDKILKILKPLAFWMICLFKGITK